MTEKKNQHNSVPPSQEALYRLYVTEGLTCEETGAALGCSGKTAHKWLVHYGLNRSKKKARKLAKRPTYSPAALETKRVAAAAMRDKITPETHRKISASNMGRPAPNKGVPMPEAQRQKLIEQRSDPEYRRIQSERQRGEKSPNWKGGVKSELNRRLDTAFWRRRRQECYARDLWTCQDCGVKCKNSADSARQNEHRKKIQAHHLVARRDGGTDDLENLVTLCMSCHHKREALLKERATTGKPRFLPRDAVDCRLKP